MIDVSWSIPDEERDSEFTGAPRPLLGTWHYLRNALRRGRRLWVGAAALGALLGAAVVFALPTADKATVSLLMVHPPSMDGQSAMATDVSFLTTREVAARTVRKLGLDLSPEAFKGTVSAEPVTTEILSITVSGPDPASAVKRADTLTAEYLAFRAEQLRSLSGGLVRGYETRIASAQAELTSLNKEYATVSQQGVTGQNRASEILTRRSQLNSQVYDMQQAASQASLGTDAAVSATHVLDPAQAVDRSLKRALVLDAASGLVAGGALGIGVVLFRALTSTRVRRREDVATALRTPVRFSVATRAGRWGGRRGRHLPWHGRHSRWARDRETLVRGVELALTGDGSTRGPRSAMDDPGPVRTVAVAAIGDVRMAAAVVSSALERLQAQGTQPFVVDLSTSGTLARSRGSGLLLRRPRRHAGGHPGVWRPTGPATLARGPRGAASDDDVDLPGDSGWRAQWEAADVVLALVEVAPGIDAENLRSWVDQVVLIVTAGASSPELLETTAGLVRAAGLELPFAMMLGSDTTDESTGVVDATAQGARDPRRP